jgi:YwiC-like protein
MQVIIGGRRDSSAEATRHSSARVVSRPPLRKVGIISSVAIPQKSRMKALTLPREHGAWGILLVPLIAGAAVGLGSGGHALPLVPLTVLTMALFCLRTPAESLLGTSPMRVQSSEERHRVTTVIAGLSLVSVCALGSLLWHGRNLELFLFGAIAGAAFGAQAILKKAGRNFRMAAQIAGAFGLTATAPAAYYIVTGRVDATAIALWLANWCFASDQIHFVQLRIHASRSNGIRDRLLRGRGFFAGQVVLALAVAFAWHFGRIPALAALAFVPLLARGFGWFFRKPEPLAVHKLGLDELTHAIVFGAITIAGFLA